MSNKELPANPLSAAEEQLGRAMVLIQRALARLEDPERSTAVQADLRGAGACLESARLAHQQEQNKGPVGPEIAAVIAAAIAAVLDGPYRLVSVKPATVTTPHFNVWALEGRTQILHSHKIR